ncbi:hypothetical protein HGRIS_013850 [Hohenbuehelia grisea]|uniref:Uncharacterized protein n=1 Tax=Hohenbuehelia grisea TaxID=104357 RepID=A0ABR3IWV6_9AGAR
MGIITFSSIDPPPKTDAPNILASPFYLQRVLTTRRMVFYRTSHLLFNAPGHVRALSISSARSTTSASLQHTDRIDPFDNPKEPAVMSWSYSMSILSCRSKDKFQHEKRCTLPSRCVGFWNTPQETGRNDHRLKSERRMGYRTCASLLCIQKWEKTAL